jgi:hypothetical protein
MKEEEEGEQCGGGGGGRVSWRSKGCDGSTAAPGMKVVEEGLSLPLTGPPAGAAFVGMGLPGTGEEVKRTNKVPLMEGLLWPLISC